MRAVHFITGATGAVGGALTLELLSKTDAEVVCLVRAEHGDPRTAQLRLTRTLTAASLAYGVPELAGEIGRRCRAIPGNILEPLCGERARTLGRVDEIWHCAASLKYKDEHEAEILRHNVDGTSNILELAAVLRCSALNYISTAYVAGRRTGRVTETLPLAGTPTNNCYEESKIRAERLVSESSPVPTRILRPAIIIGHSRTHASVTTAAGLYGCIQGVLKVRRRASRETASLHGNRFRLIADPDATLNLIPIDAVVASAVRISFSNTPPGIFHLTNACPPLVGETTRLVFRTLGLAEPLMVASADQFTPADAALRRAMRFYGPYLQHRCDFDRANADAVLGSEASHWPLDEKRLKPYIDWYMRASAGEDAIQTGAAVFVDETAVHATATA
jgi:nucleoside-diphosphate-sugar epimerase